MVCESDDVSTILISIKPEFVVSIMDGKKKYEFRKMACKKSVDKIVIYSTSPVSKVVGEADVETVLIDTPDKIWQETKEQAGINQQFFYKYYEGRTQAVAYKLSNVQAYSSPKLLKEYGLKCAPQSFCYLDSDC